MQVVQVAGGIPVHVNGQTGVGVVKVWTWPGGRAGALWFQNMGAGALVISFSEADAVAGVGITVAAGAEYLIPVECGAFWTKSVADQAFQALALIHRG
jgi:hypothetical protein